MMKSLNLKQKRFKKIIICVITAAAFIYIVAASGKYSLFPGKLSVAVDNVIKETYADNGAVIIDASSQRVIILDAQGNCREILNADIKAGKATYYSAAAITEEGIYIGEYDRQENKAYLTTERIVKYNLDGEKTGTVFEFEHTDENRTAVPFIQDITVDREQCTVLCLNAVQQSVYRMSFALNDPAGEYNTAFISTPLVYPVAAWFSREAADSVIVRDKQSNLCLIRLSDGSSELFADSGETRSVPLISADIDENGKPVLTLQSDLEGATIRFNTKRLVIQILFWLCCVWLGVAIVFFAVRKIRGLSHQKNNGAFRKILSVLFVFLLCLFVIGFYSVSLLKTHAQNIKTSLEGYAAVMYNDHSDLIDQCLMDYQDDGIADAALTREVEERLEKNVKILDQLGQGFKFALISADDAGEGYIIGDSSFSVLSGEKISENYSKGTDLIGSQIFSSRFSTIVASSYSIKDAQGNTCGYLEGYQDMGIYIADLQSDFLSRTILLVSILITIGFAVTEGKACVLCFAQRKKNRAGETAYLKPSIIRPISFFSYFSSSVNTTLLVVILKEISESAGMGEKVILISLSAAAINSGFIFGGIAEKFLMRILPQKRALQLSCIISVICYAICCISILNAQLLLFTLALFISNVFQGAVDTYCRLLAFCSQDRQQMNNALSSAWISGSAIAGVTAGILAGLYGNTAIQILGMAASLLTAIFITLNLPADLNIKDKNDHAMIKNIGKDIKLLLTDPKILALIVCIFIPIALFSGYKSYIFPYVAYESGISKSTISSIVAFCNALFFYASPFLLSGQKKGENNSRKTLLFLCIGASAVFMLFSLNCSVVWMVLALAVSTVAYKMSNPVITTLYQTRVIQIRANKENANLILTYFENSICSLCTPVVLECFLQMLGFGMACFSCGAIGLAGLVGFLILNKKNTADVL